MSGSAGILEHFYAAVVRRDLPAARSYLSDDLVFVGLFETYPNADAYMAALTGLLSITVRLDVKRIVAQGDDAAVFFELETRAPAEGTVLVAEWHQFRNGKISHVESAFDGRPYAAMFTGGPSDHAADEEAIRALNDVFARGLLTRDPKLRASIWTEDGSVVPPTGGFFRGREAMEKHFATESATVTDRSRMSFSNDRFRFITNDVAFVDADITLNEVLGPDGLVHPVVPITIAFTAVRKDAAWLIQDERAHFTPVAPPV